MPPRIKFFLSVGCLLVAAAAYFYMAQAGKTGPSYAVAFLGIFATVAMWVFPEVMKKGPSDQRTKS